ncbi:MAG TPA: spore coat U domain-containing protein [Polyangiaceae bacterium]|nr:spore coat U domain-containing protein [Polyangiaceae bacterium]
MQSFIKSSRLAAMGIVAGLLSVTGSALAADNASMAVSAEVTAICDITSTAMDFGFYNPLAVTALTSTATVAVTCTNGLAAGIQLDDGANQTVGSTLDTPVRRMASGLNFLSYELSQASNFSGIWGGTPASDVEHAGTGVEVPLTVYGRIAAGQNVPGGVYTDTVAVLVVF